MVEDTSPDDGLVAGKVRVTLVGVGPQSAQTLTVVVHPSPVLGALVDDARPDGEMVAGKVRVTVVGVGAQCVQTVTVVVQPSGILGIVACAGIPGGLVTVAVAETVAGQ